MATFTSHLFLCVNCTLFLTAGVISAISFQKRIYRGEVATIGEFPYQGAVYVNGGFKCGCALVHSRYHAITVAHCLEDVIREGGIVLVMFGGIILDQGRFYTVRRISRHPGFTRSTHYIAPADIGMIYLTEAVELIDTVAPLGLPVSFSEIRIRSRLIVSGYGRTGPNEPFARYLRKLETNDFGLVDCQAYFEGLLKVSQLCTKNVDNNGCYQGDGGNPLVNEDKTTLVGILSGLSGTCGLGYPDIYTKVSHFMSYVKAEINYDPYDEGMARNHPAINFLDTNGQFYPVPHDLQRYNAPVLEY